MSDLWLRLRALVFHKRMERDLEDELASHIEMQARKNLAAGMSEAEARRRARIQFGGVAQVAEDCRDARGVNLIATMFQDLRYALRGFRRSPIFVLTVVATIALGLGLDTALFTIYNASYFKPVAVRDPHSLYEVYWRDRAGQGHGFTWLESQEFLARNPAFSEALASRHTQARLDGRNVPGTLVTGGYFLVLGVGAVRGRTLLPEDSSAPGREPVIVLSYRAWQNRFAGDPDIIGKKVLLRGYPFEVVGVARAGFAGLGSYPSEFWVPLTMATRIEGGIDGNADLFGSKQPREISIVGRLKTGFHVSQAQAGATLWTQRFTADSPDAAQAGQAVLMSRATYKPWNPANTLVFSPILIAFSLVLLIGCANVANMMLARAMSRQREIGIRLSLGAVRGRLIRQLLTEAILLALPAAAAGFAVSQVAIRLCMRVLLATLPAGIADFGARLPALSPDVRVFGYNLAAALLASLLFGLAPALQATRADVAQAVRGDFTNRFRPARLRDALVAGQVTVCVLLLITAGILLRGVNRMQSLDAALSSRETIEILVQEKFRARAVDTIFAEPAVQILAAAGHDPVSRKPAIAVKPAEGGAIRRAATNNVSPEYFTVFELPIVRGRNFTAEEAQAGAAVAIISQTAAQRLWPNQEAVGRSLLLVPNRTTGAGGKRYPAVRVVGIARDEISRWITNGEDSSLVYFPSTPQAAGNALFVSVRGDVETTRRRLDADLAAIDPFAADEVHRLQIKEFVAEEAYTFRLAYWVSSAIGTLALLLTVSGIYGVVAYIVSQRTKEIGIRMAMGATAGAVTGLVLKQSMRLGMIGLALGSLLALGLSRLLASVLVMINTFDAVVYIGALLLVLAACAAAGTLPSRRAVRIDPIGTLRYD
jgi:predicted permease